MINSESENKEVLEKTIIELNKIMDREKTEEYKKGFNDCLEIICKVFGLQRE